MPNVYTRTGDDGTTALFGNPRVSKASLQVDAYGQIDEANSYIGYARALLSETCWFAPLLHQIQERLFTLAAEIASDEIGRAKLANPITAAEITQLESELDKSLALVGKQKSFVIPGQNPSSAALHIARTMVRKAERKVVALNAESPVRSEIIRYLNRLSDLLFMLARVAEYESLKAKVKEAILSLLPAENTRNMFELKEFNLQVANLMATNAIARAKQLNVPIVFAAVDQGGNLITLQRMEDSLLGSLDLAQGKAYTALAFKSPTAELNSRVQPGGDIYGLSTGNQSKIVTFGGGLPIFIDQRVVGGIGISGGSVEEDIDIVTYAYQQAVKGVL